MPIKRVVLTSISLSMMLTLTACQSMNASLPFGKKELTPEPMYQPDLIMGKLQTLLIAPVRMPCNTEKPMQCVLATLDNGNADTVFQIPYNWIEGFTPQPNMVYKISARPLIDQNNQKATGQWRLETILSQKPTRQ